MVRLFRRRATPVASVPQWHPSGEPYQIWDARVVDDDGCAGPHVFAVRWVRGDSAAVVCCFYPAYGDPAAGDAFDIGCMWQQQARTPGGGTWVYTGWATVGDGWGSGCSTMRLALRRAQECAAYCTTGSQPHLHRISPFDWDGVPVGPGFGSPLPWGRP